MRLPHEPVAPACDPAIPTLSGRDVHVWHASLYASSGEVGRLAEELDRDELHQASSFLFECDRRRFVVGRAYLRRILAGYLETEPRAIRFVYGPYKKPMLAPDTGCGWLRFNVTHSGSLALYAVTRDREVGIDVERISRDDDCVEIAKRFFSPRERAALSQVPEDRLGEAFFACWTRKEAYLKALGGGLSLRLDAFDVSIAPGAQQALLASRLHSKERDWSLLDLRLASGYSAALAVEGRDPQLTFLKWPARGAVM